MGSETYADRPKNTNKNLRIGRHKVEECERFSPISVAGGTTHIYLYAMNIK